MKSFFTLVIILAVFSSLSLSYYFGYRKGIENAPIKFYKCDNGTCVLSDTIPDGYKIK